MTIPQRLRLPCQLKYVEQTLPPLEGHDPHERVGAAYTAVRVEPDLQGFINAIQINLRLN